MILTWKQNIAIFNDDSLTVALKSVKKEESAWEYKCASQESNHESIFTSEVEGNEIGLQKIK